MVHRVDSLLTYPWIYKSIYISINQSITLPTIQLHGQSSNYKTNHPFNQTTIHLSNLQTYKSTQFHTINPLIIQPKSRKLNYVLYAPIIELINQIPHMLNADRSMNHPTNQLINYPANKSNNYLYNPLTTPSVMYV